MGDERSIEATLKLQPPLWEVKQRFRGLSFFVLALCPARPGATRGVSRQNARTPAAFHPQSALTPTNQTFRQIAV